MLADGSWGRYHGPHCDALRNALVKYHGVEHAILCSSGTAAVELALRAAGVDSDSEVILAAYDYKANFANVLTLGALPVLIDTLAGIPTPNPAQLERAMTDRTRAIICSHLHGNSARVAEIHQIAAQRGVTVIEDACQSPGALIDGQRAGTVGDIGVLSFGGSKLLTAGRGGAILTQDPMMAQRIRLHTQRGNDAYPLSEMQAAVLLPQLRQLDDRNQTRLRNVRRIMAGLAEESELKPVVSPSPDPGEPENFPAFYKLAFRYKNFRNNLSREEVSDQLRSQGVALDPGFPALHRIHSKKRFRAVGELANASVLHEQLMTLHHPVLLSEDEELDRVVNIIRNGNG